MSRYFDVTSYRTIGLQPFIERDDKFWLSPSVNVQSQVRVEA